MAGGTTGHSKPSKQTIGFKMLSWTSRETSGQKKALYRTGTQSPEWFTMTTLRPETILVKETTRNIVKLELTVTWQEQKAEVTERKKEKHRSLVSDWHKAGRRGGGGPRRICRRFSTEFILYLALQKKEKREPSMREQRRHKKPLHRFRSEGAS